LQWEEALLRADPRNWCLINQGSPPAIVMGISGICEKLLDLDRLRQAPLPVIRRFSGGGTVVIDENTFFITFICNTTFLPVIPYPQPIMRWTEDFYRPLFQPYPFSLQENDYVIGAKKFGGNAQSICKNRWLHHSSLLWDYQSEHMNYLRLPPKMPAYRQQRPHADFLCRLNEYWPSLQEFQERFMKRLSECFSIQNCAQEELEKVIQLPHRKATAWVDYPNFLISN
jgi:lipoate---protein ligase